MRSRGQLWLTLGSANLTRRNIADYNLEANIAVTADRALPAYGIYATWAYLGEERFPSATNIGIRPHFDGDAPSVETFIIDFDRNIYDQVLRIELIERLRPEAKFDSLEALLTQMHADVANAREILSRQA